MITGSDDLNNPLEDWGKVVKINGSFTSLLLSSYMTLGKLFNH